MCFWRLVSSWFCMVVLFFAMCDDVYSMFGEGKVKFKKKKFAAKSKARKVEIEDELENGSEESLFGAKSSEFASVNSKKSRWAKYSSLQPKETEEEAPKTLEVGNSGDSGSLNETALAGSLQIDLNTLVSQLVSETALEDDPMVVDLAELHVANSESSQAYMTVKNNTFSMSESHFREALSVLTQEYEADDVNEVNPPAKPAATEEKDDLDMYDIETYAEKPREFNKDVYAYEIMSDTSEDYIPRIEPHRVTSISEIMGKLREKVSALEQLVKDSDQELEIMRGKLEAAKIARSEIIASM